MTYFRFALVCLVMLIATRTAIVGLGLQGGSGFSDNLAAFVPPATAAILEAQVYVRKYRTWPSPVGVLRLSVLGAMAYLAISLAAQFCLAVLWPGHSILVAEPLGLGGFEIDLMVTAAICVPVIALFALYGSWQEVNALRKKGQLS